MDIKEIIAWLDKTLNVDAFNDVSNNGLQIERDGEDVKCVAFGVDASVAFFERAAEAGAELCVVHHGISWGGGIKRLTGGVYNVVKTAMSCNLALYACHLPLDANKKVGNNWEMARCLGLKNVKPAFSYHGNVIGVIGKTAEGLTIGISSGGSGEFAEEAKSLGCDVFLTGEASWADMIAAQNVGMEMVCAGHYETETFGVAALSELMAKELCVKTLFIDSRS